MMRNMVSTRLCYLLTLASGMLECLGFSGVVFGYASLVFVLKEDGYFSQLCDSVPDDNSTLNSTGEFRFDYVKICEVCHRLKLFSRCSFFITLQCKWITEYLGLKSCTSIFPSFKLNCFHSILASNNQSASF